MTMTATAIGRRNARHTRPETSIHLFAIGQSVRLKSSFGRMPVLFNIVGMLPARGNSPQYRIRNDDERHERVTTEDDLEPAGTSLSGLSLIERTFGHGQGTETN